MGRVGGGGGGGGGQSGGRDFFFFPNFIFYKLECKVGRSIKKKKKFQSALFSPHGRWTGNDFLFKGGLTLSLNAWFPVTFNNRILFHKVFPALVILKKKF